VGTRSNSSRERILQVAESIILQKGFASTSIDDILEKASLTKGGFFYHFSSKTELAQALIERFLIGDEQVFSGVFEQADKLSEDPLHRLLIFLKLFADMMGNMEETHPGCLVAGFTYENQQFNDEVRALIKEGVLNWRKMLTTRLEAIAEKYPMHSDVSIETLADMFTVIVEGSIILSLIFQDNRNIQEQVLAYRSHLRFVFGDNK
jgi:TetR/AcrR family transcriptional repressor of nem operon